MPNFLLAFSRLLRSFPEMLVNRTCLAVSFPECHIILRVDFGFRVYFLPLGEGGCLFVAAAVLFCRTRQKSSVRFPARIGPVEGLGCPYASDCPLLGVKFQTPLAPIIVKNHRQSVTFVVAGPLKLRFRHPVKVAVPCGSPDRLADAERRAFLTN